MEKTNSSMGTKKKTSASKSGSGSEHPKYSEMIKQALVALKERGGSSRQAVLKYIMANFNVGREEASVNTHLKMALKAGVKNNSLKQSKGTGASGSFRLGAPSSTTEKKKKQPSKQKKVQEKKAAAATPKKSVTKVSGGGKATVKPVSEGAKKAPIKAKKSGVRSTPKSPKKVVKKAAPPKKTKTASATKKSSAPKIATKKTVKGKQ